MTKLNNFITIPQQTGLISKNRIDQLLCLYTHRERQIYDISYRNKVVTGQVRPHGINYSTIDIDYYAATQIVMLTSQLGYILMGLCFLDDTIPELPSYEYETIIKKIQLGDVHYVRLNQKFKNKVSNKTEQPISMQLTRILRSKTSIFVTSKMFLNSDKCTVEATAAIKL